MKHFPNFAAPQKVPAVARNLHGNVAVRHPRYPGPHMLDPSPDHFELPVGSQSSRSPAGGITGGLGPFQSEQGAEMGEDTNG